MVAGGVKKKTPREFNKNIPNARRQKLLTIH